MEREMVKQIINFLNDRNGFDDWWGNLDSEIKTEIILGLENIVKINNGDIKINKMKFLKAINSGKKIKSQYWSEREGHINTIIFTDKLDDFTIDLMNQSGTPLTWKEMLGEWFVI